MKLEKNNLEELAMNLNPGGNDGDLGTGGGDGQENSGGEEGETK